MSGIQIPTIKSSHTPSRKIKKLIKMKNKFKNDLCTHFESKPNSRNVTLFVASFPPAVSFPRIYSSRKLEEFIISLQTRVDRTLSILRINFRGIPLRLKSPRDIKTARTKESKKKKKKMISNSQKSPRGSYLLPKIVHVTYRNSITHTHSDFIQTLNFKFKYKKNEIRFFSSLPSFFLKRSFLEYQCHFFVFKGVRTSQDSTHHPVFFLSFIF